MIWKILPAIQNAPAALVSAVCLLSACDAEPSAHVRRDAQANDSSVRDTSTSQDSSRPSDATGGSDATPARDAQTADAAPDASLACSDSYTPNNTAALALAAAPIASLVFREEGSYSVGGDGGESSMSPPLRASVGLDDYYHFRTAYARNPFARPLAPFAFSALSMARVINFQSDASNTFQIDVLAQCHRGRAHIQCGDNAAMIEQDGLPGCRGIFGAGAPGNVLIFGHQNNQIQCFDGTLGDAAALVQEDGNVEFLVRVHPVQLSSACANYSFAVEDGP